MYDNLITSDHLEQVVQKIQDTKASKSTTLSGYGITDSYTKTETDNRIQDIVGAAPEALDTLEEIAEALQDGESTAAGLVQTLSQKADKSTTVTNIAYGSKKITKTINGSTTDVVTINAIKSDLALTKSDVGLSNVDNTSDANKPVSNATQTALDTKVDKVSGKGLSTNDYTTTEKNKLSGIASNAQVNIIESIKVNNTVLPISSKSVNITVPTKTSELTNNSNFAVDSNYVHTDNNYTTAEKQKLASKVAELDNNGKVLSSQLPSYVDDVVEYTSLANFPTTGESGKIYVDTSANLTYRWTGSAYREISPSLALGETSSTAYRGDRGKVAYTHATDSNRLTTAKTSGLYKISTTAEGHVASAETATKSDIGLGNVNNTSDLDKPLSTATQEALNTKVNVTTSVLKSDEEFTDRQTDNGSLDIDAKYGKLKSIKGRTLVMNQQVVNGNFTVADSWTNLSSVSNNIGYFTFSAQSQYGAQNEPIISGHKYYMRATCLRAEVNISLRAGGVNFMTFNFTAAGTLSAVGTALTDGLANLRIIELRTQNFEPIGVTGIVIIDLTLMFGSGSEPTAAVMDALYPDYINTARTGYLINNAASGVETVGFNQWDEEWEVGSIDDSTGANSETSTTFRSKNYIPVKPSTAYYIKRSDYSDNSRVRYFQYDENKNYLGLYNNTNNTAVTLSEKTHYLRFRCVSSGTTYANDICISLPDPSRNGTYEPYWRSELELGLGDIKVKSHNLWDEEWEVGVISSADGTNVSNNNRIRNKNYIPCIPGTDYYVKIPTGSAIGYRFYDANKNYLSAVDDRANCTTTSPANAYYMRFCTSTNNYGATYKSDICINLSDSAFNGRYEPYGDGGIISITGGLKSAGAAYDEISGGKFMKRIESVDMGAMVWSKGGETNFVSDSPTNKKTGYNLICSKYSTHQGFYTWESAADKSIGGSTSSSYPNRIYVKDSAYTDAATFKAALSGVMLYYELAQSIEYELYNPIDLSYKVDKFGTEKLLPGSTSAIVSSPFRADIEYRTTNVTIDDVYGVPDIIKNVEDVDSRLTTIEKSINGLVTIGSGSPTTIPKNIGDFYIDVTNKVLYFATGNQLISDWNS